MRAWWGRVLGFQGAETWVDYIGSDLRAVIVMVSDLPGWSRRVRLEPVEKLMACAMVLIRPAVWSRVVRRWFDRSFSPRRRRPEIFGPRPPAPALHVWLLCAAPQFRRSGLGRGLLQFAKRHGIEHGFNSVTAGVDVDNNASLGLFRECGFTLHARGPRHVIFY